VAIDIGVRITIKQIESFLAVAETGSFSAASRKVNVAQPALSQAVKDLETELGLRLFDRTTRRVELTDIGREFHQSASKVLDELKHAVDNVHQLADRKRGRVKIAAPPLLAAVVLPDAVAEFRHEYPGIAVELHDVGTEQILEMIRAGKVDCGIGTFQLGEEGIDRIPLVRDQLMLFCKLGSRFAESDYVQWRQLEGEPLITLTRTSGIRLLVEVGFETSEVPLKPAYEVTQIATVISLVEAGLGIAVLPTYALAAVRDRAVVGKPLIDPSISRDIVMIHANGRTLSPAVVSFLNVARRSARRLAPGQ